MAYEWKGQRYDQEFKPIGDYGVVLGGIDSNAENEYWAANGGRPGSQAAPAPAPAAPAAAPAAPKPPDKLTDNVQDAINDALEQGPVVNENDPTFMAQDQANRIQSQRAAERARMVQAQRMHAQGQGDSGAFDGMVSQIDQQRGETDQRLNAGLRMNFLENERQRYAQALQLGAGIMGSREEQALRERLAEIQRQLAQADLDYRYDAMGTDLAKFLAQLQQNSMGSLFGF